MSFSSLSFIFIFLPVLILIYFLTPDKYKNIVLLLASIMFYGWADIRYLIIIMSIIFITYLGAIFLNLYAKYKKIILFVTVISILSFLIYFKYFNFIIDSINQIFLTEYSMLNIVLPIGISFYTFQALSYLFDVYRQEAKVQKNLIKLGLYICMFTQLLSGPIVKYTDFESQINSREINFNNIIFGAKRFIIGLAKKMLVANILGDVADKIFAQDPCNIQHIVSWIGAFAYTLQIYFDFSGYSDMAIGLALIFGFKIKENFNYPYISKSLSEFWRRWHISLMSWFKNYIYIPLGGNRNGLLKTIINISIVFIITGIWHGANLTFIAWGILNGILVITEKIVSLKHKILLPNPIKHLYLLCVISIGWVIFRSDSISYACNYLLNMVYILNSDETSFLYSVRYYLNNIEIITFIVAILCSTPLFSKMLYCNNITCKILINTWLIILFLFSITYILVDTYTPFVYSKF